MNVQLNCVDSYLNSLKNYINFDGRTSKNEYWCFFLSHIFLTFFLLVFYGVFTAYAKSKAFAFIITFLCYFYFLFMILPLLSATVRRLHDSGTKGEYIFVGLVPFFGTISLFVLLCKDSEQKDNQYGPLTQYGSLIPNSPMALLNTNPQYNASLINQNSQYNNIISPNNNQNLQYNNNNTVFSNNAPQLNNNVIMNSIPPQNSNIELNSEDYKKI